MSSSHSALLVFSRIIAFLVKPASPEILCMIHVHNAHQGVFFLSIRCTVWCCWFVKASSAGFAPTMMYLEFPLWLCEALQLNSHICLCGFEAPPLDPSIALGGFSGSNNCHEGGKQHQNLKVQSFSPH